MTYILISLYYWYCCRSYEHRNDEIIINPTYSPEDRRSVHLEEDIATGSELFKNVNR